VKTLEQGENVVCVGAKSLKCYSIITEKVGTVYIGMGDFGWFQRKFKL
jgi:hypothetical protein